MLELSDSVFIKYLRDIKTIMFISVDKSLPYIVILRSENFIADIHKVLMKVKGLKDFKESLSNRGEEFEHLIHVLGILGVIPSEKEKKTFGAIKKFTEIALNSDEFKIHLLPIS